MFEQMAPAALPVSVYIHYPFCVRKCPYCDFNSYRRTGTDPGAVDHSYTQALLHAFEHSRSLLEGRPPVCSVFIGGGTPSLWPLAELERVLEAVRPYLAPEAEITLEANPGTTGGDYFKNLLSLGVNRLSIGVQSFDDSSLKAIGRIHDSKAAREVCEQALQAGFTRLNTDIMHGLPGQSTQMAIADLKEACSLATHISWYELTLEEDTAFGAHPPELPAEEVLGSIEEQGFALLREQGFARYEVSAFTREKQCAHNVNYWRFGDYLGLGAGAHSKLSFIRPQEDKEQGALCVARAAGTALPADFMRSPVPEFAAVAAEDVPFEYMLNRLRLFEPVPREDFTAMTGLPFALVKKQLEEAQDMGLLRFAPDGASYAMTEQGKVMLNDVLELFLR